MQRKNDKDQVILTGLTDFDLKQTLECGQCFRWKPLPDLSNAYTGVVKKHWCTIIQNKTELIFQHTTPEEFDSVWCHYFDLNRDYAAIKSILGADPVLKQAISFAPGIRVLNQQPWEALCSFIISQNNNIKRIQGIIERLCEQYGEPLENGYFAFPTPQQLAVLEIDDLVELRCGFRAKYILDAARKVTSGEVNLEKAKLLTVQESQQMLTQIYGVGPKVAQCAMLYGLEKTECLPIDVWIKRALEHLFPNGLPEFVLPWAGIAQQYLFHYVRFCPDALPGVPA